MCCFLMFNSNLNMMEEDHQQIIIEIQRKLQFSITDPENRIHTILYENLGLQGDVKEAR